MKMLITAGPTREPIDAVRFIGNRSSGRLGLALASSAVSRGHAVTLLLGPGPRESDLPAGCAVHRFETTADLEKLLATHWPGHDLLIMAAAVADYRPAKPLTGKLPRQTDGSLSIELTPTPDLIAAAASVRRGGQRIIAFALEDPATLEARATEKMRRKGVDAIVANPLGTMESDAITALWLTAGGGREAPGPMPKADFAPWLIEKAESLQTG